MLAFFTSDGRGAAEWLLQEVADRLSRAGLRLGGAIQVNVDRPEGGRCDMDLRILGPDRVIRISQRLGPGATACRLDPDGLERAVALVERRLAEPADLVLINKFGKQEAEGRGFRPVLAMAVAEGVPVLTAVGASHRDAFVAFSGGLAEELPPDADALAVWCERSVAASA